MDQDARNLSAYLTEAGHLKRSQRTGWWIAGVRDPESVAEHSFRTGIIGYVLAVLEGADPERTAALCLFHDMIETRLGDIPSTGKQYVSAARAEEIAKDQTAELPGGVAQAIRDLVGEFEAKETPESVCARDADKLECLLQALEYRSEGYQKVQPWVDTMVTAVRTESGKRLADAACATPVDQWWHDIVASYGSRPASAAGPADRGE
jgi:putative hydrolase of HD superfamily